MVVPTPPAPRPPPSGPTDTRWFPLSRRKTNRTGRGIHPVRSANWRWGKAAASGPPVGALTAGRVSAELVEHPEEGHDALAHAVPPFGELGRVSRVGRAREEDRRYEHQLPPAPGAGHLVVPADGL